MAAFIPFLILSLAVSSTVSSSGNYHYPTLLDDQNNPVARKTVDKDDIKIYFYTATNSTNGTEVDITDEEAVNNTSFSSTKRTYFVIHGWQSSSSDDICTSLRDSYLEVDDVNVFLVDWSSISKGLYLLAFSSVQSIGELLATMISDLVSNNALNLNTTAIVGHSLGAHISGVAGINLNGEVDYIVGMDPAGPLFMYDEVDTRLSPASAQFVQVIHTCGAELGFYKPLGLADFYPNGGLTQNGCGLDITGSCSHSRSYMYYAESIISGNFTAQRCNSYSEYENDICNGTTSWMGGYSLDKRARGSFYLYTNSEAPFAKS